MSNHLTSLCYKLDVGSLMRKSTLVLLADKASDDGTGIWASKQTMADELCCSRQAVINTLQAFIEEGLLLDTGQRDHLNGYTVIYALNLPKLEALPRVKRWAGDQSTMLTGQSGVRANGIGGSRQRGLPKPSRTSPPASDERSSAASPQGDLLLGAGEEKVDAKPAEPERPKRGSRLPDEWQAPPIDELPLTTQAVVKQWPAGAYEFVATGFKAHWKAESGARASKHDWDAAWVKWLGRESAQIMAAARNGITFMLMEKTKLAVEYADVERLQECEDDRAKAIRRHLHADLGDRTYFGWFKATSIGVVRHGGGWVVNLVVPSPFVESWMKQHFWTQLVSFSQKVLESSDVTVVCEIVSDR